MTQVFLSHSTHDAEFASQLAADLRAAGVPVWKAPESILKGEEWVPAIERGLTTSTHFLLLQSPAAVKSRWVKFEFDSALELYMAERMRIIPVDYLPCKAPLFWGRFMQVKGITADYYAALFQIQARLRDEQPAHPPDPTLPSTTINITVQGSVSGTLNVAGHDVVYAGQPETPPDPDPEPLIDQLTGAVLSVLPEPFAWCDILAGQVTIAGGYKMDDYKETFPVDPFFMAKYPVTFEQFQVFIDDPQGFKNAEWWQGLAADVDHRKAPGEQAFTHDANLPRENVSWYDAVAFCRWLSDRTGETITLPTEWEWQWAAQGPDGLVYPYGNEFNAGKGNTKESGHGKTMPVTTYTGGASPYGVLDMSGNVWEWCLNEFSAPKNMALTGAERRVFRGGSWDYFGYLARASYRHYFNPLRRNDDLGFRVVVCRPPSQ